MRGRLYLPGRKIAQVIGSGWAAGPLLLQYGVQVLASPCALEPDILLEAPFAPHPQPLEESGRGQVLDITEGHDAMEAQLSEKVAE